MPSAMPKAEPSAKTVIAVKWRQAVLPGVFDNSNPRENPTTSLWEAMAPSNSNTYNSYFGTST